MRELLVLLVSVWFCGGILCEDFSFEDFGSNSLNAYKSDFGPFPSPVGNDAFEYGQYEGAEYQGFDAQHNAAPDKATPDNATSDNAAPNNNGPSDKGEILSGQGLSLEQSLPKLRSEITASIRKHGDMFFDSLSLLGHGNSLRSDSKSNLIVSYTNFSATQPLRGLLTRNQFFGQLVQSLLGLLGQVMENTLGKIKTVYLKNIGMEIFQLPEDNLLGFNDFLKLLATFPDYVDGVFLDKELNSFEDELEQFPKKFKSTQNYSNNNIARKLQTSKIPNDTHFKSQWAHTDSGHLKWGIETPNAWQNFNGEGTRREDRTIVALIDSGVDYNHPDLVDSIWKNPNEICDNGIDDDQNGLIDDCQGWDFFNGDNDPMDDNGHGTASAGVIAARADNSAGIAGVCWASCQIMPLKTLNAEIKGTVIGFVRAIDYAIGQGAKISNNSYGGRGSGFKGLEAAVRRAREAGMIFVAAAGNYKGNNDNDSDPVYPASYKLDNVISVAAITRTGQLADFSSYGKTSVDLAAPGEDIFTTSPGGGYKSVDGTSFAVPFVSGAVALIWAQDRSLDYLEISRRVKEFSKPDSFISGLLKSGGTLDVARAIAAAQPNCAQNPQVCGLNSTCLLIDQQHQCRCHRGYKLIHGICQDIDECQYSPCGQAASCHNFDGTFECRCKEGYKQVGNSCEDVDECRVFPGLCPTASKCINLVGTFDCLCPSEAAWNARTYSNAKCLAIRSPSSGPCVDNGGCGANSLCASTGSWWFPEKVCHCLEGYVRGAAGVPEKYKAECLRPNLYSQQISYYLNAIRSHY